MVEGSDVGELTVEDPGVKITVRRQDDRPEPARRRGRAAAVPVADGAPAQRRRSRRLIKIESPMVGTFYRSPVAQRPSRSWRRATASRSGQTLCILEAMKLFNEFKSEHAGVIRSRPGRERRAGRVRPAAVRARAGLRPCWSGS